MRKILAITLIFIMLFQISVFAECGIVVDEKSASGATISISGAEVDSAVGIWVDFDDSKKMLTYQPVYDISFVDGNATLSYNSAFENLKFILVKDLSDIMPLCDAAEISLDDVVTENPGGMEDMGDI